MSRSSKSDKSAIDGPPVRLGVDATSAARTRTGIGHYTASLLEALGRSSGVELELLTHGLRSTLALPGTAGRAPARLAVPGKLLLLGWHHLRRPSVDRLLPRAEVVFSPNYLVLPTRRPLLVTVHDLHFLDGGGQDHWSGAFLAAHLRRHLERHAARVLTDSHAVRTRLLETLPGLEGRVEVLYPGVRERYRGRAPLAEREAVLRRWDLPGEFLLCVGELSPRKNQLVLLEALARAGKGKLPALVLCGLSEPSRVALARAAAELGLAEGSVRTLPYLADEELHPLLSAAHALVCPSVDEGFGLVVAEALSLGVPVACSAAGSLPEVGGGLALHFDARDPEAAADALLEVTLDEQQRERQRQAGPGWTARFSVEAAAGRLVQIAREASRAGRP